MKKSAWTGKASADLIEVRLPTVDRIGRPAGEKVFLVEPKHEAELRRWMEYVNRSGKRFLGWMLGLSAVTLGASFLGPEWQGAYGIVAASIACMGVTILLYPFATPETNRMMGMKKARTVARMGGFFLLLMALVLALRTLPLLE